MSAFTRIASWLRENARASETPAWLRCTLEHDAHGIRLIARDRFAEGAGALSWFEVDRVVAFNADMLVHDLVCLQFESRARSLVANEEMAGFHELARALPARLDGAAPFESWWEELVRPLASATRVIFERAPR